MFAIDLEKRYNLEFIRNYGDPNVTETSPTKNTVFSSVETDNVYEAFVDITPAEVDTSFVDDDYAAPKEWTREYGNGLVCIYDDKLYMFVDGQGETGDYSKATFKYGFKLDFDVEFDYVLSSNQFYPWALSFVLPDIINSNVGVKVRVGYVNSLFEYKIYIKDNVTDFVLKYEKLSGVPIRGSIKVTRVGHTLSFYAKDILDTVWTKLYEYTLNYKSWVRMIPSFTMEPLSPGYGDADLYISRFAINKGVLFHSDIENARWVMFTLLNGDSQDRLLKRLGVYTRISEQIAPATGYNNSWTPLGPAVTMYSGGNKNLAFSATVSGTDTYGPMSMLALVDGDDEFNIYKCWGVSEEVIEPYFIIDLGEVQEIYRIIMKHAAADPADGTNLSTHMIHKYTIEAAETAGNYTTIFSIDNNSLVERVHDLDTPIKARWVRVVVFTYDTSPSYIALNSEEHVNFIGPVLREIEIYPYYGFSIISSDDYPIIAFNLKDQFYLEGVPGVIGPWKEDDTQDWISNSENTCYSDSIWSEPEKVYFDKWGSSEVYEQWVVTKNLDATDYKSGERLLKHLTVHSVGAPNPVEHFHWWSATNCSVSNALDMSYYYCTTALKVDYPKSNDMAKVTFIEGDHFGVDDKCTWRDALAFRWYISDYDAVDWSAGKIRFGGKDGTTTGQQIYYEWYFTSMSGAVHEGWNEMFLRFKGADYVDFNQLGTVDSDPRTPNKIDLKSIDFQFKGNNTRPFMFEIDGFTLDRNIFEDHISDAPGLYLANNDSVTFPMSSISLASGAISMWIRPDTYFNGMDEYGETASRNIFTMTTGAGDVLGSALTTAGIMVYYGNTISTAGAFKRVVLEVPDIKDFPIDDPWFFALAFSNNGKGIDSAGTTLQLFINGVSVLEINDPWFYEDDKYSTFILGGAGSANALYDNPGRHSAISAVIAHVKIYSYARTDFYKDMYDFTGELFSSVSTADLIEISRDNVTFYKVDDPHLPFIYRQVPDGDEVSVYVRSVIPENMMVLKDMSRTVKLLTQWYIGV